MIELRDRAWCNVTHICHHWFEEECSWECDLGKHDHPINSPECDDR